MCKKPCPIWFMIFFSFCFQSVLFVYELFNFLQCASFCFILFCLHTCSKNTKCAEREFALLCVIFYVVGIKIKSRVKGLQQNTEFV